ncbi:MAG TPA: hypothetical protein VLV78_01810 [Thermoanaerobaculia bacterium]|nr:hypothetical protein [Thermoanaerobaculia bacterium]
MAMGIALWLLCGAAVFAASRMIRPGRPDGFTGELIAALIVALAAGLGATALDFGGWNEIDWRAGAFVLTCSFAAVGTARVLRLLTRRVA